MGITLFFKEFGEYLLLMKEAFKKPQNIRVFRRKMIFEMQVLGVDSVPIVFVISIFIGAAVVMQMLVNLNNPIYPSWVFGYASKKSIILEFSPTVISLILAGKCASRIASEIGTQRISEQIDALEVMGVNTPSYLILPKIIACLIFFPLLTIISIFTGLFGGALGAILEGSLSIFHYVEGIRLEFTTIDIVYALTKSAVFALIVSSIACYRGYTIKGGSVEVGQQSTKAVVQSCMVIMIFNLLITSLFN
ncbi:MAG: MlaE family ABC transporter permease [Bacteroidales bacterium]|jgi:phospholipid/cholesterol/gamma-HCH transport system permease protein|nr:ABC transporter permease [Bacteroidales bacterium]